MGCCTYFLVLLILNIHINFRTATSAHTTSTIGTGTKTEAALFSSKPNSEPPENNTTIISKNVTSNITTEVLPFRVCSASTGGEIFRFPIGQQCPDVEDEEHVEGIAVVIKKNIIPHMFKIRKYRKLVTSTRIYTGMYDTAITNQYTTSYPMPLYEINLIDKYFQCFSSIQVTENGHVNVYTDRDDVNKTVHLQPVDGLTENIVRYNSQPKLYVDAGWAIGFYRTRTTVNCELTIMTARSVHPYEYFTTASGDFVEMSPFLHSNGSGPSSVRGDIVQWSLLKNHTVVSYDNREGSTKHRFLVNVGDHVISWEATNETDSTCKYSIWKGFSAAIQTKQKNSYHFVANEVTATFTTPLEQDLDFNTTHSCLWGKISEQIETKLNSLSKTHKANGTVEFYKTTGNLYIAWQPIISIQLAEAFEALNKSNANTTEKNLSIRKKRDLEDSVESSLSTSQLQFAYDNLRSSINKVLQELSKAWCREQQRAAQMWFELSKINPTSVMSAIYGKPVSARFLGDVISVTECVIVDQTKVDLRKSMRVPGSSDVCYSRPIVTFRFKNGTDLFTGQLGPRNEILLSTNLVETCKDSSVHYFQSGSEMHKYVNYYHKETINIHNISTLNTFITLNLTFIENIDFEVIELYSREEKRLANVLDIESMFREYNYYTQRISGLRKDLQNTVENNRDAIIRQFGNILQDLGSIGSVVVNVASGVFTLFGSIVTGFINFIKNPLGGMMSILLIVGVVVLVFFLNRRTRMMYEAPIKMFYPNIEQSAKDSGVHPIDQQQLKSILLAMHNFQQEEHAKMLQEKESQKTSFTDTITGLAGNLLRKRKGYSALPQA
ncbi:envelope glycoprotein B [Harp seal herpesvirus]|uniref:Envelope glycoprotein B n=1 Tax=phocid gammaherpesvirus 3 TaxID=2560643 RepID=A0A0R5YD53_9GAMA|nr:envelope glycoprotein B [Harp seal herpesvirus]AJG42937.1 envelope glycoprotein B [Harp seal herpesvirus]